MRHIKPRRWISVCGIGIAVTTAIIAAATTGSCVFGTTTNFCEQFGLHCKEGQECAAHQPVCIDIGGCGDGIVDRDKGEVCDDGNIIDGQMMAASSFSMIAVTIACRTSDAETTSWTLTRLVTTACATDSPMTAATTTAS